jgi:hypothetical protein
MDLEENMQDFNIPSIDQEGVGIDNTHTNLDVSQTEESKSEPAQIVQETDSEALSSLLMLSKSNADQGSSSKPYNEVGCVTFSFTCPRYQTLTFLTVPGPERERIRSFQSSSDGEQGGSKAGCAYNRPTDTRR